MARKASFVSGGVCFNSLLFTSRSAHPLETADLKDVAGANVNTCPAPAAPPAAPPPAAPPAAPPPGAAPPGSPPGGSFPPALGRFASSHPNVKLEVQIGVSSALIEQLDAGRLDVVFAKRPLGTSRGRLVWREPLIWAAAETFDLVAGAALPLALYRDHSVSRDAALIALRESELVWQIVYTSPSLTGVRAAALAGLAITPLPASAIVAGLRVLGVDSGLPLLPDLEFAIFERERPDGAAAALTAVLVALGQTAVRPTAG